MFERTMKFSLSLVFLMLVFAVSSIAAKENLLFEPAGLFQAQNFAFENFVFESEQFLTTKTWDGGGATNNWSDAANWSDDVVPTASDDVVFDSTSTKNATIDVDVTLRNFSINGGYTGTITVSSGKTFSLVSAANFSQASGTFSCGAGGAVFFNYANFNLSGGLFDCQNGTINSGSDGMNLTIGSIFNAPSGTMTFTSGNFVLNAGGTFNHNNGTVVLQGANDDLNVVPGATGTINFNNLTINANQIGAHFNQAEDKIIVNGTLNLIRAEFHAPMEARGDVIIAETAGGSSSTSIGSAKLIIKGDAASPNRTITLPTLSPNPNLFYFPIELDAPNTTINASGAGPIKLRSLDLIKGTFNAGNVPISFGIGGSFTNSSLGAGGTFNCDTATVTFDAVDFTQSGGSFNCQNGTINSTVSFNLNLTGGTFNAPSGTMTIVASGFTLGAGATFNHNNGTVIAAGDHFVIFLSSPTAALVVNNFTANMISGHSVTIEDTGGILRVLGTLNLSSGAFYQDTASATTGILEAQGDVVVASGFGIFNGNPDSANIVNFRFGGANNQTYTNNGGSNPRGAWSLNKSGGTVTLASDLDISNGIVNTDFLTLTSGTITTGNFTVNAGTRTVTGSANGYINGKLRRNFNSNGVKIFPVGTANGYSPASANVINGINQGLTIGATQTTHPNLPAATSLARFWTVTEHGSVNANLTFNYLDPIDINGSEANYRVAKIDGNVTFLSSPTATISAGGNSFTVNGETNFAEYSLAQLPASQLAFVVQPTDTAQNAAITPAVQVAIRDAEGNTITNATDAITIAVGSNPGSGTLSGTLTRNAVNGVATFDNLSINNIGGDYTLVASSGSLSSATSDEFNIVNPFVVTKTGDDGVGSLRQAILNSNAAAGTQTITFNIPGSLPRRIKPSSGSLPPLTDSVIVDATTQPGYNGSPVIELDGTFLDTEAAPVGFTINGAGSTVKGFSIIRFKNPTQNTGVGIAVNSSGNTIEANYIGIATNGATLGNGREGIKITGQNATGNRITADRISDNGTLGIKLNNGRADDNGLINDTQDADAGANNLQNYPTLYSAINQSGTTRVEASLNSTPSSVFTLEFFSSPTCDASGWGEGEIYEGSIQVTTDAGGIAALHSFNALPFQIADGRFVSITATDAGGSTSEFSRCALIGQKYQILGRVTEGGQPLANVQVSLTKPTAPTTSVTATNSDGYYSFSFKPPDDYTLTVSKAGYTFTPPSRFYPNLSADQTNQDFTAARSNLTISGKVQSTYGNVAAALGGVTVSLSNGATTQTDDNGNYTFNNVTSGNYTLTATKANFTFSPPSYTFSPLAADQTADFTAQLGSPLSGRVVFHSNGVSIMNADGSALNIIETVPDDIDGGLGKNPAISPNGSKIAFIDFINWNVDFENGYVLRLYTMNYDGTGQQMITPVGQANVHESSPIWSPDGTKIAFVRRNSSFTFLKTIRLDTSDENGVVALPSFAEINSPTWSPDGTKIAFAVSSSSSKEIRVINSDGNTSPQTLDSSAMSPSWSPDGTKIAFIKLSTVGDSTGQIALMNPDGTNVSLLSADTNYERVFWSPDGMYLGFVRKISQPTHQFGVIKADGSIVLGIRNGGIDLIDSSWGRAFSPTTPSGSNVSVGGAGGRVIFTSVSGSGQTSFTPIAPNSAGAMPGNFVAGDFGAYEITTTASVAPPITVCFIVPTSVPQSQFNQITILHRENGSLVAKPTSRDFPNRRVCASVNSLSPFVLAEQINANLPRIAGLARDNNGNPLSGAQIKLTGAENRTTTTDSNGAFAFPNLTAGANYNVQPKQIGYIFDEYSQDFVNLSGENTIVFSGAANNFQISGRVADVDGNGIGGITVSLDGANAAQAVTDANGNYAFANLPADGGYLLNPSGGTNMFNPAQIFVDALTGNIGGATFVQFAPTAASAIVAGRVKNSNGKGISDARVLLTDANGNVQTARTNFYGYYRFDEIPSGQTYIISVEKKWHEFSQPTRVLFVGEDITDADFTASP